MSNHLTPTEISFRLLGGYKGVAAILGQTEKAPLGWKNGSKWRDAGDIPSVRTMRTLLAAAAQRRIALTANHLIYGGSEAEIAALMPAPDSVQVAA